MRSQVPYFKVTWEYQAPGTEFTTGSYHDYEGAAFSTEEENNALLELCHRVWDDCAPWARSELFERFVWHMFTLWMSENYAEVGDEWLSEDREHRTFLYTMQHLFSENHISFMADPGVNKSFKRKVRL